jgi:hypothetical protein
MTPRVIDIGVVGAQTLVAVPALKVHTGDYLLVRRITDANAALPRGTLVFVGLRQYRRGYRNDQVGNNPRNLMIGQIAGLPGESISIRNKLYFIGTRPLDPNMFPVPAWLQQHPLKSRLEIPRDAYFVSSVYRVAGQDGILTDAMIADVCMIKTMDIHGRAFMRWLPLARRGYIEYNPPHE